MSNLATLSHPNASTLRAWFDHYRRTRGEREAASRSALVNSFDRMRVELAPLQARLAARMRDEAPDFNVFRILRLSRREVVTHTPFLANLLNPAGTHAQRELFLHLFLERLLARVQPSIRLTAAAKWMVLTEQVTDFGNFDIHLRSRSLGCQIVIENKIDAADQHDQLLRYWTQMGRELSAYPHRLLVYLTRRERQPGRTSQPLPPYVNLTYQHDVQEMLAAALTQITAPRLRHSLQQYVEIIQTF